MSLDAISFDLIESSMADNKTKPTTISVETFLDGVADIRKRADAKALIDLMQEATGELPVRWGPSIIGFGSYRYKYESGREGDSPLVGFSPRKGALDGIPRLGCVTRMARQTHDRQVVPLYQEARRCRPACPAPTRGQLGGGHAGEIPRMIGEAQCRLAYRSDDTHDATIPAIARLFVAYSHRTSCN